MRLDKAVLKSTARDLHQEEQNSRADDWSSEIARNNHRLVSQA